MQPTTKTIGGGAATGLGEDWVNFLRQGLNTGTFGNPGQQAAGATPIGSTQGIAGFLNSLLSGGGGNIGGSLQQIIKQQQAGDVGDLRARYSMGGVGAGTPSAYAESLYRAQAAPQAAMQIGNLQMSALLPLLQMITQLSGRGIPQAATAVGPSPFSQFATGVAGLAEGGGALRKAFAPGASKVTTASGGSSGGKFDEREG